MVDPTFEAGVVVAAKDAGSEERMEEILKRLKLSWVALFQGTTTNDCRHLIVRHFTGSLFKLSTGSQATVVTSIKQKGIGKANADHAKWLCSALDNAHHTMVTKDSVLRRMGSPTPPPSSHSQNYHKWQNISFKFVSMVSIFRIKVSKVRFSIRARLPGFHRTTNQNKDSRGSLGREYSKHSPYSTDNEYTQFIL